MKLNFWQVIGVILLLAGVAIFVYERQSASRMQSEEELDSGTPAATQPAATQPAGA